MCVWVVWWIGAIGMLQGWPLGMSVLPVQAGRAHAVSGRGGCSWNVNQVIMADSTVVVFPHG